MSIRALNWAREQTTGFGAGCKFVLMTLADHADEANSCWPGQETIAQWCEMSERSVRRHLAELEEAGFITSSHRYIDWQQRKSDRYVLLIPEPVAAPLPANLSGSEPQQDPTVGQTGHTAAPTTGQSVTTTGHRGRTTGQSGRIEPTKEPPIEPKSLEPRARASDPDPGRLATHREGSGLGQVQGLQQDTRRARVREVRQLLAGQVRQDRNQGRLVRDLAQLADQR